MNMLITGGAGFIGCNAARLHAERGDSVLIFDNLSRRGASLNLAWLQEKSNRIDFVRGDVRDAGALDQLFRERSFDIVLHMASQVAVTTSVSDPREDFEINALGTFNVLEAMRKAGSKAVLVFASTNKVYGGLEQVGIVEHGGRYQLKDQPEGIAETFPLDFHSPYGCSKGAGDQYVRDYHRIYGLKTVVFRQSCIYGYRQFGIEDQGWVAWFTLAALAGKPVTIYGDGKQVRDVLFIEDLIDAYDLAVAKSETTAGQVYNIGGGTSCQFSLLELVASLEQLMGRKLDIRWSDWRPGDQKVFVSDVRKAARDFDWVPRTSVQAGIEKLFGWMKNNMELFRKVGLIG